MAITKAPRKGNARSGIMPALLLTVMTRLAIVAFIAVCVPLLAPGVAALRSAVHELANAAIAWSGRQHTVAAAAAHGLPLVVTIACVAWLFAERRRLRRLVDEYRPQDASAMARTDHEGMSALARRHRRRPSAARRGTIPHENDFAMVSSATPYDLVFGVDSIARLCERHWVAKSPTNHPDVLRLMQHHAGRKANDDDEKTETTTAADGPVCMATAIAVMGGENRGKTTLLNGLFGQDLPADSLVHTEGISLKWLDGRDARNAMVLIDTAGARSPVDANSERDLVDRRATEAFIEGAVFDMASQIVLVVGDLTTDDQSYIAALTNTMGKMGRTALFLVHNFRDAHSEAQLWGKWREQVLDKYASCGSRVTFTAASSSSSSSCSSFWSGGPHGNDSEDCTYTYFLSRINGVQVRHLYLARQGSAAGRLWNRRTFAVLHSMLQTLAAPRPFDPFDRLFRYATRALPTFADGRVDLTWTFAESGRPPVRPEGPTTDDNDRDDDGRRRASPPDADAVGPHADKDDKGRTIDPGHTCCTGCVPEPSNGTDGGNYKDSDQGGSRRDQRQQHASATGCDFGNVPATCDGDESSSSDDDDNDDQDDSDNISADDDDDDSDDGRAGKGSDASREPGIGACLLTNRGLLVPSGRIVFGAVGFHSHVMSASADAHVSVHDEGDRLAVAIEMPGVAPRDVSITVHSTAKDHYVQVTAVRCRDGDHDGRRLVTAETVWPAPQPRLFGRICVNVNIPPGASMCEDSVRLADGVLWFLVLKRTQALCIHLGDGGSTTLGRVSAPPPSPPPHSDPPPDDQPLLG